MTDTSPIILIDVNGLGHAAQQSGARLHAGSVETTAVYGVLSTLRLIRQQFAGRMIALWDGRSWRHSAMDGYKANRKNPAPKAAEMRDAWREQRFVVQRVLPSLGVHQMIASNWEADDLAGHLTHRLRARGQEVVLVTRDEDWLQLLAPGVVVWDHIKSRLITPANFADMVGLPTPYSLVEFKCLVGDLSDCIPGVGGIGEKTALALIHQYGSVGDFLRAMQDEDQRKVADRRTLRLLNIQAQEAFQRNLGLIQLNSPATPKPEGLQLTQGRFDLDAFRAHCEELAFHSILGRLSVWAHTFSEDKS